jgi:hypothetical protein
MYNEKKQWFQGPMPPQPPPPTFPPPPKPSRCNIKPLELMMDEFFNEGAARETRPGPILPPKKDKCRIPLSLTEEQKLVRTVNENY